MVKLATQARAIAVKQTINRLVMISVLPVP
jgi:hypothetical protein